MFSYPDRPFFLQMNNIQKSKSGLFSDFVSLINYLLLSFQNIIKLNTAALILTILIILYSNTKNEAFLPGSKTKFIFQKHGYIFVNISISAILQHLDNFQIISLIVAPTFIVASSHRSSFIFIFCVHVLFIISALIHRHSTAIS